MRVPVPLTQNVGTGCCFSSPKNSELLNGASFMSGTINSDKSKQISHRPITKEKPRIDKDFKSPNSMNSALMRFKNALQKRNRKPVRQI